MKPALPATPVPRSQRPLLPELFPLVRFVLLSHHFLFSVQGSCSGRATSRLSPSQTDAQRLPNWTLDVESTLKSPTTKRRRISRSQTPLLGLSKSNPPDRPPAPRQKVDFRDVRFWQADFLEWTRRWAFDVGRSIRFGCGRWPR